MTEWWRDAVFYQIYVRSFADSNGDGIGDLAGIESRLDYLAGLGVDALWLTPFYRSPMADHGYDVANPRDVDPSFGDLSAFDRLIASAHQRGIKVTVDIVPNHVSSEHPWFVQAVRAGAGSQERSRFIFRNGRGEHGELPPNNWPSIFGGPAWTRVVEPDGTPGQWYLHLFAPEQPDVNWDNFEVAGDLQRTLRFWLNRGVDGFRVDVAHGMAKPMDLPDLPDHRLLKAYHGDPRPMMDNDAVHEIHRMIRSVLDEYPGAMAVGEVWVGDHERRRRYVRRDELQLAFDFSLAEATWEVNPLQEAIESGLASVTGTLAPPCWVLSNHDIERHVTRYGGGAIGTRRARAAALVQLALPGVAYLYQGDELGLPNVDLPDWALRDPIWERSGHAVRGRDGCRVPLPWQGTVPPLGFSDVTVETGNTEIATTEPWLPMPESWSELTVERQAADPDSVLTLYRDALRLRRKLPTMRGGFHWLNAPDGCLAFARKGGLTCVVNTSDHAVSLPVSNVEIALFSQPLTSADGEMLTHNLLPGNSAVWLM